MGAEAARTGRHATIASTTSSEACATTAEPTQQDKIFKDLKCRHGYPPGHTQQRHGALATARPVPLPGTWTTGQPGFCDETKGPDGACLPHAAERTSELVGEARMLRLAALVCGRVGESAGEAHACRLGVLASTDQLEHL